MICKGVFILIYKYKKSSMVFLLLFCILPVTLLLLYIYRVDGNINFISRMVFVLIVFYGYFITVYSKEYVNRFVEFKSKTVVFNSFRIDKKVRHFNVKYEDILSLEAVKIPLLGIYKVKVKAKNVPYIIPITWCMKKHNELFYNLCSYADEYNPKVYIDNRLIEQLKKKGYYNEDK